MLLTDKQKPYLPALRSSQLAVTMNRHHDTASITAKVDLFRDHWDA